MIRAATAADAPAMAALWNPLIRDTVVTFASAVKTVAEVEALIATRQAAGHGVLVAERGGWLCGFATYAQFRTGAGYATCMEHTILLAPEARGQGTGAALLGALLDHARNSGAHQMIAGICAENPGAVAFHARQGFAETGRIAQAGHKFGRFLDLVLMQKFL